MTTTSPWAFAEELAAPMWIDHHWNPRQATADEADLSDGWRIDADPGISESPLVTAYQDLADFARAGEVPSGGPYRIVIELAADWTAEEHRLLVEPTRCLVTAGGIEGIRRALFWLEELMRAAGGPFLPLGEHRRSPVITTRISRCFFGPINRPPANRDELADDVDYYPEHYLNRLAHEGVNGLWLTVRLRDLVPTDWSGPVAVDPARRFAKLRRTVERCRRYGIRIFLFCIDPAAFGDASYLVPAAGLTEHPELGGHRAADWTAFCTQSEAGGTYLRDSLRTIFTEVPGLGGLIDITLGERPTHCWSDVWSGRPINCPRCGPAGVGPSFRAHLTALRDGVHSASPDAEVISWMYVPYGPEVGPYAHGGVDGLLAEIAACTPEGVTVQVNMESNGSNQQDGRELEVLDYSLAWIGPSPVYTAAAEAVAGTGGRLGAKLQVGCSHEVATVPYVPVPGNLYRKYRALHELGASAVMQCWYFGNAPGPMTTAAGRLSFAPLPETEAEFLAELAAPDWGTDAPEVVAAWEIFRDAYAQFPAALPFSWFGPVHDSIMWSWHLDPVDGPIAPSWQLGWWPSGDRVGECFAPAFSFDDIVTRVSRIAGQWESGWQRLAPLADRYHNHRARMLDLGVAEALSLQWGSAARTLKFYQVRENLARGYSERDVLLTELQSLVDAEQAATLRLAELAEVDTRLGFHSEAEGHKYHPEGLRSRAAALRQLVTDDLVRLRARATEVGPLWPGWSEPDQGEVAVELESSADRASAQAVGSGEWKIWREGADLRLTVQVPVLTSEPADELVEVVIEGRRLWPAVPFRIRRDGVTSSDRRLLPRSQSWQGNVARKPDLWAAEFRLPIRIFQAPGMATERGFRINVTHRAGDAATAWIDAAPPLRRRLCFDQTNPVNLGWVIPRFG